jgi:7-cyano-7-deazaguanine synthase
MTLDDLPQKSVLMLSGGIDSTALAYLMKPKLPLLRGVFVNYGQENVKISRRSVNSAAHELNIPVEHMVIPGLVDSFRGYLDEEYEDYSVMLCEAQDEGAISFFGLTTLVAVWAATIGYDALVLGYNKSDREGDSSRYLALPEIHTHLEAAIGLQRPTPFKILVPFWDARKSDVIHSAIRAGAPLEKTWSCWTAGPFHCGKCPGCEDRREGFAASAVQDPGRYQASEMGSAAVSPGQVTAAREPIPVRDILS